MNQEYINGWEYIVLDIYNIYSTLYIYLIIRVVHFHLILQFYHITRAAFRDE